MPGTDFINDLKNSAVAANGTNTVEPKALTTTTNGAAVDLVDSDGNCFASLHVGAVTGTTPTLDVKIQESDTSGGTYSDITGATFAQQTTSNHYLLINFKRSKRFCRAVATIGGSSPSFTLAVALLGIKKAQ
jgi:hypothetical protein